MGGRAHERPATPFPAGDSRAGGGIIYYGDGMALLGDSVS